MIRRLVAMVLLALPLLARAAEGQGGGSGVGPRGRPGGPAGRQQLEQQLRRNLWRIAKERIGLSDDQMLQLAQTSQRYDVRRRQLVQDERAQRQVLRTELLAAANADQDRVAAALDRLLHLQRGRVDLQAEEQRELAKFMSPLQRAKYAALQEQVRRRMDALRRQRSESAPDRPIR